VGRARMGLGHTDAGPQTGNALVGDRPHLPHARRTVPASLF
jgi:hypothetical protein